MGCVGRITRFIEACPFVAQIPYVESQANLPQDIALATMKLSLFVARTIGRSKIPMIPDSRSAQRFPICEIDIRFAFQQPQIEFTDI